MPWNSTSILQSNGYCVSRDSQWEVTRTVRRGASPSSGRPGVTHMSCCRSICNSYHDCRMEFRIGHFISSPLCIAQGIAANERTLVATLGPLMGQSGTYLQWVHVKLWNLNLWINIWTFYLFLLSNFSFFFSRYKHTPFKICFRPFWAILDTLFLVNFGGVPPILQIF